MSKERRGSTLWGGTFGDMVKQYQEGDIVVSTLTKDINFSGVVKAVYPQNNKIHVAWLGGAINQHDPDEIAPHPFAENLKSKYAITASSRRVRSATCFQVSPARKTSLMDEFIHQYFTIYTSLQMYHWQTLSYAEHKAFDEAREEIEELMDKFVEGYQGQHGRIDLTQVYPTTEGYQGSANSHFAITQYGEFLKEFHGTLMDSSLKNIVDEMIAVVNKLLYLMTLDVKRVASMKKAMYWCSPGRRYQFTKKERDGLVTPTCPKCRHELQKEKFKKQEKIFVCSECGFKVPQSDVFNDKSEVPKQKPKSVSLLRTRRDYGIQ